MKKYVLRCIRLFVFVIALGLYALTAAPISAREGAVLGIHILHPDELIQAKEVLTLPEKDEWHYVTIPYTLADVEDTEKWQAFFDQARQAKIIPVVRLVTHFEDEAWQQPNRKEVVDQISTLSQLDWPTDKKHIIIFNEVNHAKEWGGEIDPESYARVFRFAANWAHAENANFVVMPAAMDLAAPNGRDTMEAFNYLEQMLAFDAEIFAGADLWNSHSYPNPGFSSSPTRTGKNSLRGFEHELTFLKERVNRDYQVMITETGWEANRSTSPWLESYYAYALQHIWSDPRVVAVTPFVLKGDPGPFSGFGFVDREDKPTLHYQAMRKALELVEG